MIRHIVVRRTLIAAWAAVGVFVALGPNDCPLHAQASRPTSESESKNDLERLRERLGKDKEELDLESQRVSGDLTRDLERLGNYVNQVPTDLRGSSTSIETIHKLIDEIVGSSTAILSHYDSLEPVQEATVRYQRARAKVINHRRHLYNAIQGAGRTLSPDEQRALLFDYLKQPYDDVDRASTLVDAGELENKIEFLRGQMFYFAQKFEESAKVYAKLMQRADLSNAAETCMAYIGSLERSQQFTKCLEVCEQFLANPKINTSSYLPHVINVRQKMLTYLGRVEAAVKHFDEWGVAMEQAYAGEPVEKLDGHVFEQKVAKDFETFLDRAPFQRAFVEYAAGDIVGARASVQASIDHFEQRAQEGPLRPEANVFLSRSQWMREILDERHGQPAPPLSPVEWVNRELDLEKERGNVTLLLFFPYESERHAPFLQATENFLKEKYDAGLRAAWIATPKGRSNDVGSQKFRVLSDANRLGITYPSALALIPEGQFKPGVLDPYSAVYGTATLVVVDRRGRIAWAKQDPTFRDFGVANRVVGRLLSAPK